MKRNVFSLILLFIFAGTMLCGAAPTPPADNLLNKGILQLRESDYEASRRFFQSYLKNSISNNDARSQGEAHYWLSIYYRELKRFDESLSHARQGCRIYESLGNPGDVLRFRALLIEIYMDREEYRDARLLMQSCEKSIEESLRWDALCDFFLARGYVLAFREERELPLKNFQSALKLARENDDPYREALCLKRLADEFRRLGEKEEGEEYCRHFEKKAMELEAPLLQADSLKTAANLVLDKNDIDSALRTLFASRTLYKACGNKRCEASVLLTISSIYRLRHDSMMCLKQIDSAIELYREDNDPLGLLRAYFHKALIFNVLSLNAGKDLEVIAGKIREIEEHAKNPCLKRDCYIYLSQVLSFMSAGDQEIADILARGAEILGRMGDKGGELECLMELSFPLARIDKYDEALSVVQKALVLSDALGSLDRYDDMKLYQMYNKGKVYERMALLYKNSGHNQKALEFFRKSLIFYTKESLIENAVFDYMQILHVSIMLYDIESAIESLKEVIVKIHELKSPADEAEYYGKLMRLLDTYSPQVDTENSGSNEMADIEDSLASILLEHVFNDKELHERMKSGHEAWIEYASKRQDIHNEIMARRSCAKLHIMDRNYREAEEELKKALAIAGKNGDFRSEGLVYEDLSILMILEKRYCEAIEIIEKEIRAFEKANDRDFQRMALIHLGWLMEKMENNKEAQKFRELARALRKNQEEKLDYAKKAREIYHMNKDADMALNLFSRALEERKVKEESCEVADILNDMGVIYSSRKDMDNALRCFRKAFTIYETIHEIYRLEDCALDFGQALEQKGLDMEAADIYAKTLDLITSQWERVAHFGGRKKLSKKSPTMRIFERLINLLLKSERFEDALKYLELSHSLELLNGIRLDELKLSDNTMRELMEHFRLLRQKMLLINNELQTTSSEERRRDLSQIFATTREDFFKTLNTIKRRNPDFEMLFNVRGSDLAALQNTIPQNALLLEYYPSKDGLYIFIVSDSSFKIREVEITRERLYAAVREFREKLTETGSRGFEERGSFLYSVLLHPVEEEIEEKSNLIIVPGGLLWYLPFEALGPEKGEYLIGKRSVSYLSSAHVLNMVQRSDNPGKRDEKLLVIGAPSEAELPHAEKEVEIVASIHDGSAVFSRNQATKSNFLKNVMEKTIIHIATHSVLNREDVNNTYIQLAGDDGRLYLGEIYGLLLSPSCMVVLSLCESAIGEDNPGGEFASLSTAFTTAGASSIIASEWKVEDEATSELFAEFYRCRKNGASKGEALRSAKLSLLKRRETSHPFYWGGFILLGDWR